MSLEDCDLDEQIRTRSERAGVPRMKMACAQRAPLVGIESERRRSVRRVSAFSRWASAQVRFQTNRGHAWDIDRR